MLYTAIALIAFAANSLLCRMALAEKLIDPWSFTLLRLLSAAVGLGIIMAIYSYTLERKGLLTKAILAEKGSWLSSLSLVIYALCFSLAYVRLDTGTGALILFSAVQLTMIGWGIYQKERLSLVQWLALGVALLGFVYLMLPSAAMPSIIAALIMATSGAAWGIYSVRGKTCVSPIRATGFNFIKSLIVIPVLFLAATIYTIDISVKGLLLACASGALASGVGYSIWYTAMPLLKTTQAAIVQFCVPILAAIAGVIFLAEPLTMRFVIASSIILGAVLVFLLNKDQVVIS